MNNCKIMRFYFIFRFSQKAVKTFCKELNINLNFKPFHSNRELQFLPHSAPTWILNPSCGLMRARVGSKIKFATPTHPPGSWICSLDIVRCPHPSSKSDKIASIGMCGVPPPSAFQTS